MNTGCQLANLWRQFFAAFYDSIIVIALWMVFSFIVVALNHFHAVTGDGLYFFRIALITVWALFYSWFIYLDGRTIGMLAWRLRVINQTNQPVKFKQVIIRFFASLIFSLLGGVNFWWKFIDKKNLTLADRISNTKLIIVPAYKAKNQIKQMP